MIGLAIEESIENETGKMRIFIRLNNFILCQSPLNTFDAASKDALQFSI
jgi:hypothetical protein